MPEKKEAKKEEKPQVNVNVNVSTSGDKKVNWVLVLVMSIIFGSIGVDRFIMGHVGLGILKLITLGGCGVWWLIDVILIATKHKFKGVEWTD
ncbi:TM2 domain-containing protein [Candidatus Woesearchaeota archaeon]|nr:TM2 domain-containing protein [Candidatus Woesearchaeota archaeon]